MGVVRICLASFGLVLLLTACGTEVARTTGNITGYFRHSGGWPVEGSMLLALFEVNPWEPDFVPGPPAAFHMLQPPSGDLVDFAIEDPGVPFGTYQGLVVAWQDPTPPDQSQHMLPVLVYGTSLDDLSGASPLILSEEHPDILDLELPSIELYSASEDMRAAYAVEY